MKFELTGKVVYWKEIGNQGIQGCDNIHEEFQSANVKKAIAKASQIAKKIGGRYPQDSERQLQEVNVELRIIESVWKGKLIPKRVKKQAIVDVTENKLKGFVINTNS